MNTRSRAIRSCRTSERRSSKVVAGCAGREYRRPGRAVGRQLSDRQLLVLGRHRRRLVPFADHRACHHSDDGDHGMRSWRRSVASSKLGQPVWQAQASWTVNTSTGNDENAGTGGAPLLTLSELARRLSFATLTAAHDLYDRGQHFIDGSASLQFSERKRRKFYASRHADLDLHRIDHRQHQRERGTDDDGKQPHRQCDPGLLHGLWSYGRWGAFSADQWNGLRFLGREGSWARRRFGRPSQ